MAARSDSDAAPRSSRRRLTSTLACGALLLILVLYLPKSQGAAIHKHSTSELAHHRAHEVNEIAGQFPQKSSSIRRPARELSEDDVGDDDWPSYEEEEEEDHEENASGEEDADEEGAEKSKSEAEEHKTVEDEKVKTEDKDADEGEGKADHEEDDAASEENADEDYNWDDDEEEEETADKDSTEAGAEGDSTPEESGGHAGEEKHSGDGESAEDIDDPSSNEISTDKLKSKPGDGGTAATPDISKETEEGTEPEDEKESEHASESEYDSEPESESGHKSEPDQESELERKSEHETELGSAPAASAHPVEPKPMNVSVETKESAEETGSGSEDEDEWEGGEHKEADAENLNEVDVTSAEDESEEGVEDKAGHDGEGHGSKVTEVEGSGYEKEEDGVDETARLASSGKGEEGTVGVEGSGGEEEASEEGGEAAWGSDEWGDEDEEEGSGSEDAADAINVISHVGGEDEGEMGAEHGREHKGEHEDAEHGGEQDGEHVEHGEEHDVKHDEEHEGEDDGGHGIHVGAYDGEHGEEHGGKHEENDEEDDDEHVEEPDEEHDDELDEEHEEHEGEHDGKNDKEHDADHESVAVGEDHDDDKDEKLDEDDEETDGSEDKKSEETDGVSDEEEASRGRSGIVGVSEADSDGKEVEGSGSEEEVTEAVPPVVRVVHLEHGRPPLPSGAEEGTGVAEGGARPSEEDEEGTPTENGEEESEHPAHTVPAGEEAEDEDDEEWSDSEEEGKESDHGPKDMDGEAGGPQHAEVDTSTEGSGAGVAGSEDVDKTDQAEEEEYGDLDWPDSEEEHNKTATHSEASEEFGSEYDELPSEELPERNKTESEEDPFGLKMLPGLMAGISDKVIKGIVGEPKPGSATTQKVPQAPPAVVRQSQNEVSSPAKGVDTSMRRAKVVAQAVPADVGPQGEEAAAAPGVGEAATEGSGADEQASDSLITWVALGVVAAVFFGVLGYVYVRGRRPTSSSKGAQKNGRGPVVDKEKQGVSKGDVEISLLDKEKSYPPPNFYGGGDYQSIPLEPEEKEMQEVENEIPKKAEVAEPENKQIEETVIDGFVSPQEAEPLASEPPPPPVEEVTPMVKVVATFGETPKPMTPKPVYLNGRGNTTSQMGHDGVSHLR